MNSAPLYVVGLGPGDSALLTPEASACLNACQVLVGYTGYIDLVPEHLKQGKEIISTGMMGEMARSEAAIDAAVGGKTTAVVCSGDPGVYALAGLILELLALRGITADSLPLHILPGVPAVCAAAALLGAPLMHDFACVSLSDLLTSWEIIVRRLQAAFEADFVVALYNPRSKRRREQLTEALDIARRFRSPETPVGIVRNAYRPDQYVAVAALAQVEEADIDMFTIVLIGNSTTRIVPGSGAKPLAWECGARILTPRGYTDKYSRV